MADVYLRMLYVVELSDKDLRLIGLALAGKLKRPEDLGEAAKLNLRLLEAQKIRIAEQQTKIDGALQRLQEGTEE